VTDLPILIPAVLCILTITAYVWLQTSTPPPTKTHTRIRYRDPYQMKPMGTISNSVEPKPRTPTPTPRAPKPQPGDIHTYRQRVTELENELAAANNLADQLARQLKLDHDNRADA